MNKSEKILNQVKEGYNRIAEHFSATRHAPWQEFKLFADYIKPGQKIIDLACGNGRFYKFLRDSDIKVDYYGLDNSANLIKIAKEKYPEIADRFALGEMFRLPYQNSRFDLVICIASFHHLPDKKLRLKTLAEIYRVLNPGGYLLMTNWYWKHWHLWRNFLGNFWQKKSLFDFFFPWKSADGAAQCFRYYHLFKKKELKKLFDKAGFKTIKLFPYFKLNKQSHQRGVNIVSIAKKC